MAEKSVLIIALSAIYTFIISLTIFTEPIRAVRVNGGENGDDVSDVFPIVYPKLEIKDGKAYVNSGKTDNCLFYAEGISVVVFSRKVKQTAWADFNSFSGKVPSYIAKMTCQGSQRMGESFEISIDIKGNAEGFLRNKKDKKAFTVTDPSFTLHFNFTQPGYWELVKTSTAQITVKKGGFDFLDEDLSTEDWVMDERSSSNIINGFKDYSFACALTKPIIWTKKTDGKSKDPLPFAIGISLKNVQFQPFNATYMEGGKDSGKLKFGWKVNDCEGLFSIGTWMGLIVALLLIGVLSFGFLMLNSVQTMDRFDDPKQKQLIINAKE